MTCLRNPRVIFPANSNGSAKAAVGIARTDYAGHSFPDGAYFGTHRVSRNAESGLPARTRRQRNLRLRRISAWIFQVRTGSGAIRVLELLVRVILSIWLFGMLFALICCFIFRVHPPDRPFFID